MTPNQNDAGNNIIRFSHFEFRVKLLFSIKQI
jgi:hypothetical protein